MKTHLATGLAPRLSLTARLLLVCMASIGMQAGAEEADKLGAHFPESKLDQLPYLHFSGNNLGEAYLFRMRQEDSTIEVDGQRYIGFKFWSTGLVEWLFINTPGEVQPGTWLLVNDSGEQLDAIQPEDVPLNDCPRIVARYPQASRVSRYKTSGEALERRGRYHLLQRIGDAKPAPYALSFTSSSPGSYEAGRSGDLIKSISHPPLRDTSDVVLENMKEIRREKGTDAAVNYLTKEMELRIDDGENSESLPKDQRSAARTSYYGLYINSWYEGQIGGGRLDANWGAAVYGVMYDVCRKRGHYARTDVATNLTSSLMSACRYGKLAEVFEVWKEGMRLGGYNMDTTTYPDLGPAFDILPKVRKRDIPTLAPYSKLRERPGSYKNLPSNLSDNQMSAFGNYAAHLWYQGHWQESLEWLAWSNSWASNPKTGEPKSPFLGHRWHLTLSAIAYQFSELGFWEEAQALHEHALRQKITGGYEGLCTTEHKMAILMLKSKIGKDLTEDAIEQARASILQADGNIYEQKKNVLCYKSNLGELLIQLGHVAEGEALLDELAAAGLRDARIARLTLWVKTGRAKGVETELLQLLKESRETGRKMDEIVFYRLYADFLEQQGRLREALWVRRELVRLYRAFDIFTHLPVEMARLAVLLNRLGIHDESLLIANQARELLGKGEIPDRMIRNALALLNGITPGKELAKEKDPAARVEFQPIRSVIIPLKGASWTSHFTLTNPTGKDQSGTLQAIGLPVHFREVNEDDVDIVAVVGGNEGEQKLVMQIEPARYKVIALQAADGFSKDGEFSLTWTPAVADDRTESQVLLEKAAEGATKAVIQAGAYQMNPFYGIPVYHHYVDAEAPEFSRPMRFVSSLPARLEIYAMDGSPIGIDAQGNGSLLDAGDEIFGTGDGAGNLRLPLAAGITSFVIRIYPLKELPAGGLGLRIECLDDNQWQLYAEDSLMPAAKK